MAALRELKEETGLTGEIVDLLGTTSHFNTIHGDILLLGMLIKVKNTDKLQARDDAEEAKWFHLEDLPPLAFQSHIKIVNLYLESIKIG